MPGYTAEELLQTIAANKQGTGDATDAQAPGAGYLARLKAYLATLLPSADAGTNAIRSVNPLLPEQGQWTGPANFARQQVRRIEANPVADGWEQQARIERVPAAAERASEMQGVPRDTYLRTVRTRVK